MYKEPILDHQELLKFYMKLEEKYLLYMIKLSQLNKYIQVDLI